MPRDRRWCLQGFRETPVHATQTQQTMSQDRKPRWKRFILPTHVGYDWVLETIWCDPFKKNSHVITTHFEISFLELPWKLMYNLHHNLTG